MLRELYRMSLAVGVPFANTISLQGHPHVCLASLFVSASSSFSALTIATANNGSVYAGGFGCIGVVLAAMEGEAGFYDDWFLQAEYSVLMPSIVFAVAMLAEFWVEGLPSQVRRK